MDGYAAEMERHREISRAAGGAELQRAADFAREAGFESEFVGDRKTDVLTQIGAFEELEDGLFLAKLRESPFYPAGGGQVTDQGWIELDSDAEIRAELVDAYRFDSDQVLLLRGDGLRSRRPGARGRELERPFPDHGEPHRDAPAASGAARGARRPRGAGRVGRPPGQAPLRLHAWRGAERGRARRGRAPGQREDLRRAAGARLRDAHRGGPPARGDDALRREVRGHRARRRDPRLLGRALRWDARAVDRRDRCVRDPLRGLDRLRVSPHRSGDLGGRVGVPPGARARVGRVASGARRRAHGIEEARRGSRSRVSRSRRRSASKAA